LGKRRKAREFALQVLYQGNIAKQGMGQTSAQLWRHFSPEQEQDAFAEQLIRGVLEHGEEIDRLIVQSSEHWRLDRMSIIDRNVLRIALYELLYCPDIPPKVTLNEAIDLAKQFGSEESGSFINGILDRIQKETVRKKDPVLGGADRGNPRTTCPTEN
jgi:transcription antitermination protein NusB